MLYTFWFSETCSVANVFVGVACALGPVEVVGPGSLNCLDPALDSATAGRSYRI